MVHGVVSVGYDVMPLSIFRCFKEFSKHMQQSFLQDFPGVEQG